MSSNPLKILVSGDVDGKLGQLYKRIESVQKKGGSFDMLFCVGDFFGDTDAEWQKYASGAVTAPIQTFILGPNKSEHVKYYTDKNGGELCDNITFLGKTGIYTGSSGLKLAYLSGLDGGDNSDDTDFSKKDIDALKIPLVKDSNYKGVDILLTSCWPAGVEKYAISPEIINPAAESQAISQLALALKPRYYFASGHGTFYERQPYRNHKVLAQAAQHVTRFIAVANVGNTEKKKWLYAFNLIPMAQVDPAELVKQPQDVTECPYKVDQAVAAQKQDTEESSTQFFFNMNSQEKKGQKRPGNKDGGPAGKRPQPQPTGPCWFCLGSPEVEKHLIVSVSNQTYLSLAKGGLTADHVLICPIGHHQSIVKVPQDVKEEIDQYKSALKKYFKSQGKTVVFFERNYKTQHLQIQVVPISKESVSEVLEAFQECAADNKIELHELPTHSDLKQIVPAGAPYFYAELPSGEKLLHRVSKGFPLQFGREAVTGPAILDMPERVDWKNCKQSKDKESSMAAEFRKTFKPYDFNLS